MSEKHTTAVGAPAPTKSPAGHAPEHAPDHGAGHAAGYAADLKEALTGSRDAGLVWLCNFEVENEWARGYTGLPAVKLSTTSATVQRMEELGALLAEPTDHLLLDRPLDAGFRRYLEKSGLGSPAQLHTEAPSGAHGGTAQAVLDTPALLARLRSLAAGGHHLAVMGNSRLEHRVAQLTGLRPASPDPDVCERVNSKIYSRELAEELGLRTIPGHNCRTVADLHAALEPDGGGAADWPVIVKDAYGVSGKGLVVLGNPGKAVRLLRMVDRRARNTGSDDLHVVVERFLPKRCDLNYQFTIARDGAVRFDFVKEALTSGGVHRGHLMPAGLTGDQEDTLRGAAGLLGERLYADGFFGIVGVDALLGEDGLVYPVLEINARLNMSSYQGRVTERFLAPGGAALAKHYPLRLRAPLSFEDVEEALGPLAAPPEDGRGLVVTCFGTVNAQAPQPSHDGRSTGPAGPFPFDGRLYALLFGADRGELDALDERVQRALAPLGAPGEGAAGASQERGTGGAPRGPRGPRGSRAPEDAGEA